MTAGPVVVPSTHDTLTGLPSRQTFCRELERRVTGDGAREPVPVAVLVLGVDDFRDVNSGFGHGVGDTVLVHLAARLSARLSPGWSVARNASDEFAVLAPLQEPVSVEGCVRAIATVLDEPFAVGGDVRVQLSGSIGVAATTDTAGPGDLLRNAEIAMYRAKHAGQRWAHFDAAVDGQATDRLRQVAELRAGIAAGQLEVHYQPVVDLGTGVVTSVEALVRWRHPRRGPVPPIDFVGLAERSGLIGELTEAVLAAVGEQARAWARAGRSLPCAVNLSLRCLVDPDVTDRLVDTLASLAGAVTVEVTESVLADERAVVVLERLAAAGVPCAVDDFGTGFSSLAAVKHLPVTTLKIDRAFTRDIDRDDRDLALVRAIVEMARALGLDVIAEGVETEQAAARLRSARVPHGQGYWFARPMPAGDLEAWLTARESGAGRAPGAHLRGQDGDDDRPLDAETLRVLLDSTRSLLRVTSAQQAAGVLVRTVTALGGTTAPASVAPPDALPIDIGLGESEPLLALAAPDSRVRANLEGCLPALVEDARSAADRATQLARLSEEVGTDPLTGLGNRRGLFRGRRTWLPTDSIAVIDLDDLTTVGGPAGLEGSDRVLVAFARALRRHLRSDDLAYRLGGDEFLVILPRTGPEGVLTALEHLRREWAAERPLPVTFSAGVAGVDEAGLSAALIFADAALYGAKRAGGDRCALSGAARLPTSGAFSGELADRPR